MKQKHERALFFFTKDLRLSDNVAITEALTQSEHIHIAYILDPRNAFGSACKWFLHYRLKALQEELSTKNIKLHFYEGKTENIVANLCSVLKINHIFYNRQYDNVGKVFGAEIKGKTIPATSFNSQLMHEPAMVKTKTNTPFKNYTAFSRVLFAEEKRPVIEAFDGYPPQNIKGDVQALSLKTLQLLPTKNWANNWPHYWCTTEKNIKDQWLTFLKDNIQDYAKNRDIIPQDATSRLSAALAFGCISPNEMWHEITMLEDAYSDDFTSFKRQLIWREFSYYQLHFFPALRTKNWKPKFDKFEWSKTEDPQVQANIKKWQMGQTGLPLVDAGMRELWSTGYMHNRVRMVVASFLIKNMLIPWQYGERWFWDTLVEADPANNGASWQWVAGSGADAAPYFRIFNPYKQSERFDPQGDYIRKWVPELNGLSTPDIHSPHTATPMALLQAGVTLGVDYPHPIVDTSHTRQEALARFKRTNGITEA